MANNEILKFGSNASLENILTQAEYASDVDLNRGHQSGEARKKLINKTHLQLSTIAAGVGEFVAVNQTNNVTDDLTPATFSTYFTTAMGNAIAAGGGGTAQADWNENSGVASIINRPTIHTLSALARAASPLSVYNQSLSRTANNKILSVGGQINGTTHISTVYSYDVTADVWTLRTAYPIAIQRSGLARLSDGRIISIMGSSAAGTFSSVVRAYDEVLNTWTTITTSGDPITARGSFGCCTLPDNSILVVGGETPGLTNTVYKLVITGNAGVWTQRANLPVALSGTHGILVDNNTVLAFSSTNIYAYNISSNTWSDLGAHNIPNYNIAGMYAGLAGGRVWLGGHSTTKTLNYMYNYGNNSVTPAYPFTTGVTLAGCVEFYGRVLVAGGNTTAGGAGAWTNLVNLF